MLNGVKEEYLPSSERTKFSRAHNYLERRSVTLKFDENMRLVFKFLKRYHLLGLELGCKSYKLRGKIVRVCL